MADDLLGAANDVEGFHVMQSAILRGTRIVRTGGCLTRDGPNPSRSFLLRRHRARPLGTTHSNGVPRAAGRQRRPTPTRRTSGQETLLSYLYRIRRCFARIKFYVCNMIGIDGQITGLKMRSGGPMNPVLAAGGYRAAGTTGADRWQCTIPDARARSRRSAQWGSGPACVPRAAGRSSTAVAGSVAASA